MRFRLAAKKENISLKYLSLRKSEIPFAQSLFECEKYAFQQEKRSFVTKRLTNTISDAIMKATLPARRSRKGASENIF